MPNVLNIILDVTDRSDNVADDRKEQERAALHSAIWSIADDLRGSVDGWDFKSYVLGTMFYRYISENFTAYVNANERAGGDADFDYAKLDDAAADTARAGLIQEKGFYIAPSELFVNLCARAPQDANLNESLEKFCTASRTPRRARRARTTSRDCSTTSTSTATNSGRPSQSATKSSSSSSRASRT